MEQLTAQRAMQTGPSNPGRLIEVQMLMRKVSLKLSRDQIGSFISLMQIFLSHYPVTGMQEKSIYLRVLQLFERRIRMKLFMRGKSTSIKLDLPAAEAVCQMASWLQYYSFGPYEQNFIRMLIEEIHHQTT
jgi:hypothetical protein